MRARRTDPEELHRTAWLILGTMVTGIAVFAAIAGVLREDADPGRFWLVVWALAGPPLVVVAKVLQRRLIPRRSAVADPHREAAALGGTPSADDATPATALTAHVLAWALIEAPAILGCAAYLLGADAIVLTASLVTAAVGFALTAPRREAFGLR